MISINVFLMIANTKGFIGMTLLIVTDSQQIPSAGSHQEYIVYIYFPKSVVYEHVQVQTHGMRHLVSSDCRLLRLLRPLPLSPVPLREHGQQLSLCTPACSAHCLLFHDCHGKLTTGMSQSRARHHDYYDDEYRN